MSDRPIWQKLDTDTDKSYEAFCIYRDMGAQRSIERAWLKYQDRTDTVSGYFRQWSSEHNWVDRVAAYDEYLAEKDRVALEKARLQVKTDALQDYSFLRKAITKMTSGIEDVNFQISRDELRKLIDLMQVANAYARLNVGLPDEIKQQDIGGKDTNEIIVKVVRGDTDG